MLAVAPRGVGIMLARHGFAHKAPLLVLFVLRVLRRIEVTTMKPRITSPDDQVGLPWED
jgi:hypothetical protein